ncbi:GMC oxidoreductase [Rhizobium tubonense]|uniref:Glucose-methanol-choline oxidoreductase n=1 Tax=Rhizobium tubonense TaxID=484088 RepID=A0A2W4C7K3_9HYPH|nr:GMC family oxidoreductase [Rhizobium tubonense]PZM07428.1 glucose-methanol-choline oxidoreductase [Rhizobium tubonense]
MTIRDLRSAPHNTILRADIVIVGGGPAGLTIARELANTKIRVLVVDSGGLEYDIETQALNGVENVGEPVQRSGAETIGRGYANELSWLNDIPAFELRNRLLGGSSHTWLGKCAAFDDMDFASRPWLRHSGWPFKRRDIQSALDRASELLNLGPNVYDEGLNRLLRAPPAELGISRDLLRPFFWQFSKERGGDRQPMRFINLARDCDAANVDFLTHATVTEINLDRYGRRISSLDVSSLDGKSATIRADTVVLCGGGIENARLLLASNSVAAAGIGNGRGVVGRYLVDHPRATLIRFTGPGIKAAASQFNFFGLTDRRKTHFYLRGLSLSPEVQAREGLTNCAAYPAQVHAKNNPWAALRRLSRGTRRTALADLSTVVASSGMIASGLYGRLVHKRGLPHKSVELRFDVMAEQQLDPESRITLSDSRDAFGIPRARVDWKIGTVEIESMKRFGRLLCEEFNRVGLPGSQPAEWIAQDDPGKASFIDMAHPSCTTRMGNDPSNSVVDADAMVHGIDGLFIAGSSVFPTGGHANPTLMILALAIRLSDHLKSRHRTGITMPQPFVDAEASENDLSGV